MRRRLLAIVGSVVLLVAAPTVDAFFIQFVLHRLLAVVLWNRACQTALTQLGRFADCTCDIANTGLQVGSGDFECSIQESQCLVPPNLYCVQSGGGGVGDFAGQIEFGLVPTVALATKVRGCFNFDSGPPMDTGNFGAFRKLCLTVNPRRSTELASCSVTIGGQQCSKCETCNSGQGITFSCANVDVGGGTLPAFVPGPEVSTCIHLGLTAA
jgi:hypothetical protein